MTSTRPSPGMFLLAPVFGSRPKMLLIFNQLSTVVTAHTTIKILNAMGSTINSPLMRYLKNALPILFMLQTYGFYGQNLFIKINPLHPLRYIGQYFVRDCFDLGSQPGNGKPVVENDHLVAGLHFQSRYIQHAHIHTDHANCRDLPAANQHSAHAVAKLAVIAICITNFYSGNGAAIGQ